MASIAVAMALRRMVDVDGIGGSWVTAVIWRSHHSLSTANARPGLFTPTESEKKSQNIVPKQLENI
jgi:hypothetical protein